MRFPRSLTIPALALAIVGAGLTIGAATPTGVGTPTPPPITVTSTTCQEDEPCWDCETMGNLICGTTSLTPAIEAAGWEAWDFNHGWAQLRTTTTDVRVEVIGYALTKPDVTDGALALQGRDGVWYVFRGVSIN